MKAKIFLLCSGDSLISIVAVADHIINIVEATFLFQHTNCMESSHLFSQYNTYPGTWDEMYQDKAIRSQYQQVFANMSQLPDEVLQQKDKQASELFMNQGITFTVYSDDAG